MSTKSMSTKAGIPQLQTQTVYGLAPAKRLVEPSGMPPTDRKQSQVVIELARLEVQTGILAGLVVELDKALEPVQICRPPASPTSQPLEELRAPLVALAENLNTRSRELEEAIQILRDILKRLEL